MEIRQKTKRCGIMSVDTCAIIRSSSPQTGEGGPDVGEVLTDQLVLHPGHGLGAAQLRPLLTAKV